MQKIYLIKWLQPKTVIISIASKDEWEQEFTVFDGGN